MSVIQEDRVKALKPDVKDTGYGVKYVNVEKPAAVEQQAAAAVVKEEPAPAPKRVVRQRKVRKGE